VEDIIFCEMFSELEAPKPNGELPVNLLNYIEVLTVLFGEHAPLLVLAVFELTKLISNFD
jgi:hypothetical protein